MQKAPEPMSKSQNGAVNIAKANRETEFSHSFPNLLFFAAMAQALKGQS
jgi:hypothetical protein